MLDIEGVKVFSATKAREREMLGEMITDWLRANDDKEIVDKIVTQSSDSEFHCITITLFYTFKRRPMCEVDWCEERQGHSGPHTGESKKPTLDDVSRDTYVDETPKKRLNFGVKR